MARYGQIHLDNAGPPSVPDTESPCRLSGFHSERQLRHWRWRRWV